MSFNLAGIERRGSPIDFITIALMPLPIPGAEVQEYVRRPWHWPEPGTLSAANQSLDHCPCQQRNALSKCRPCFAAVGHIESPAGISRRVYRLRGNGPLPGFSPGMGRTGTPRLRASTIGSTWPRSPMTAARTPSTPLACANSTPWKSRSSNAACRTEELYKRGRAYADYVMKAGPVLRHGDSLGATAAEKIPVCHEPSVYNPEQTVCRIYL